MSTIASVSLLIHIQVPSSPDDQVPPDVLEEIRKATTRLGCLLAERAVTPLTCPGDLQRWEQELHATVPRECIDPVTGAMIRAALEDPVVDVKAESLLATMPGVRLQKAKQAVTVDLLGGGKVTVKTPYFLKRGRRGGRRGSGRGKSGNGVYPLLAVVGIHERLTPAYGSLVAREVVLGSIDDAQAALARRGVDRDRKAIGRVVRIVGRRALAYEKWMAAGGASSCRPAWDLRGKRIGICLDGGKLRTRTKKRGRRRANGGKSFGTDWREPRVIVVYELDSRGRKRRHGLVRYDATIANADAVFALLAAILREVGATQAELWVIAGDGAPWIWDRAPKLAAELGYDPAKVVQVVDFYHAVTYLTEFASYRAGWTEKERTSWVDRMRRLLRRGAVDAVIKGMKTYCVGRKAGKMGTVVDRFIRNKDRMRYQYFRKEGIPCGSGVVESAVRRIINLRLKGPGIFWKKETAEGLLHLRARLLSGDWDGYISRIFEPEALWGSESGVDRDLAAA